MLSFLYFFIALITTDIFHITFLFVATPSINMYALGRQGLCFGHCHIPSALNGAWHKAGPHKYLLNALLMFI